MIKITIFTPTYNRAHTLERCYKSILTQDNLDNLEWILINDGSTDNTDDIVASFLADNKLNIRYIKQEDSDDTFVENMLFNIFDSCSELLNEDDIIGIRCLAINSLTNNPSGRLIKNELIKMSWFEEFSNNRNFGERIDILKTDVIKNFLYPVNNDIRFIPEIWFYTRLVEKNTLDVSLLKKMMK